MFSEANPEELKTSESAIQAAANPRKSHLLILGFLLLQLPLLGLSYYLGTLAACKASKIAAIAPSPTVAVLPSATPTVEVVPTSAPVKVPSAWISQTAWDREFGIKTTLSLPKTFVFKFANNEFEIQSSKDAQEIWLYTTSVFPGKNGLKNYYDGSSRRAWYQSYLHGEFSNDYQRNDGDITQVLDKGNFLELAVANAPGGTEKHFVLAKDGLLHIIKPASQKAYSAQAELPALVPQIFASLSSTLTK